MEKLKTIVVEDERLPRLALLAKLEDWLSVLDVIDVCDSYESARDSILRNRPDLLFLDIQLHGQDSLKLLEELKQSIPIPHVIFTTAYSDRKYLMGAIKLSAVDYLLKPIGKEELAHAIAKAVEKTVSARSGGSGKLCFKTGNSLLFMAPDEIAGFKAEGNYSTLISFEREELVLESLLSLEQRLPGSTFLRADRSTIVNIRSVCRLNLQEQTCTLQGADGRQKAMKLSKNGLDLLTEKLQDNPDLMRKS